MTDNFDKWIKGMSEEQYEDWLEDDATTKQEEKALNIRTPLSKSEEEDYEREQESELQPLPKAEQVSEYQAIQRDTSPLGEYGRKQIEEESHIAPSQREIQVPTRLEQQQPALPAPTKSEQFKPLRQVAKTRRVFGQTEIKEQSGFVSRVRGFFSLKRFRK